jgi:S-methylmethionine-dependent homocysteine/selenocysteine methylase
MSLETRLAHGAVIILDGGTGTELERRGVPMDSNAWAALAVLEHGDVLRGVHEDYIRAGAEVIITNTFSTTRYMLEAAGLGDRVEEINRAGVEAALRARDAAAGGREVWVAGSISPMAPGADTARRPSLEVCAESFREQARILAAAGVDLIALEMMRDVDHTVAAIEAAQATGLPVWVGFSCQRASDGRLELAPRIAETVELGDGIARSMARGGDVVAVMHSDVEVTDPALDAARARWSGPLAAYPHSGHFIMPHWQFDQVIGPEAYLEAARGWVAKGARIIGGCCGIGPEHIRLLAEGLPKRIPATGA